MKTNDLCYDDNDYMVRLKQKLNKKDNTVMDRAYKTLLNKVIAKVSLFRSITVRAWNNLSN